MSANSFIALVAAIPLVLCMAMIWWSVRVTAVGSRHTILVFGWLCAALTATLVVFALFPTTTASGTVLGVTLGGAGAFVLLVWMVGLRATTRAARRDAHEARVARKVEAALRPVGPHPAARQGQEIHLHQLSRTPDGDKRYVAVVTGDIRRVQGVDVWVNSENTEMAMSRVHDFSISGVLRYEAARR